MNAHVTTAGQVIPGRLFKVGERYIVTLLIAVSCIILYLNQSLSNWAVWQRADPFGFQVWISHFSHWSGGHLFWDLLMFTCIGAIIEAVDRRLLIRILLISPVLIIGSTWLMENHLNYRGLSGLDCALYAALIVIAIQRTWISYPSGYLLIGLLLGKCAYEIFTGNTLFVSDLPGNVTAVPWAHLSGAVAGVLIAITPIIRQTALQACAWKST